MKRKEKSMPESMEPWNQREAQAAKDKATLIWASERGAGTQPASFPEVNKAPQKSQKNIKR